MLRVNLSVGDVKLPTLGKLTAVLQPGENTLICNSLQETNKHINNILGKLILLVKSFALAMRNF